MLDPTLRRLSVALAVFSVLATGAAVGTAEAVTSHPSTTSAPVDAIAAADDGTYTVTGAVWGPVDTHTDNVAVEARDGAGTVRSTALSYGGLFSLYLPPGAYTVTYTAGDPQIARETRRLAVVDTGDPLAPQFTGENVRLRYIAAVASVAPRITGTHTVGHRLRATAGRWNHSGLGFTYRWVRGGRTLGGVTNTHRVTARDIGRNLRVRVIANTANGTRYPGTAHSARVHVPKAGSRVRITVHRGKAGKHTVHAVVRGAAGISPKGRVTIRQGTHSLGSFRLHHGRVNAKVRLRPHGTHRLVATYRGSRLLKGSHSRHVAVRAR